MSKHGPRARVPITIGGCFALAAALSTGWWAAATEPDPNQHADTSACCALGGRAAALIQTAAQSTPQSTAKPTAHPAAQSDNNALRPSAPTGMIWIDPFTELRAPLLTNLLMDPFERAEHENYMGYQQFFVEHMFMFAPAGAYVARWLQSFKEFPPRQKPGSFNLERVMEAVTAPAGNR